MLTFQRINDFINWFEALAYGSDHNTVTITYNNTKLIGTNDDGLLSLFKEQT